MNLTPFLPVIAVRAGHSSLIANLNRFNVMYTTERECGDSLQTEEHFWDHKLYRDQRTVVMDILYVKSKRITKLSYRALKARAKMINARRLLFKDKMFTFIKKVNIQNGNSLVLEWTVIFENRGATAMIELWPESFFFFVKSSVPTLISLISSSVVWQAWQV
jgi:hypothetical protein